jgi:phosphatidylserine/phosphatidylglycerophosphate/cardiolipin synthase-like enzyme
MHGGAAQGEIAMRLAVCRATCLAVTLLAGCATAPAPNVCFSPGGHCADVIVHEIGIARHSIYVQAYGFTHPGIAQALPDAETRGVDVEVILDKSNRSESYSEANFIANAGIKTFIDARHPIAHNKVIVIDEREVITGSFNFTRAADEKNAENLVFLKSPALAKRYLDNWRAHQAHSDLYRHTE